MEDFRTPLRQPWKPAPGTKEAIVMDFMRNHGHPGYDNEINEIAEDYDLIQGEAGLGHGFCSETQARLDSIDRSIQTVVQEAVDRYDDWATDAYP